MQFVNIRISDQSSNFTFQLVNTPCALHMKPRLILCCEHIKPCFDHSLQFIFEETLIETPVLKDIVLLRLNERFV